MVLELFPYLCIHRFSVFHHNHECQCKRKENDKKRDEKETRTYSSAGSGAAEAAAAAPLSPGGGCNVGTAFEDLAGVDVGDTLFVGDP